MTTAAPGSAAPLSSVTVPAMVPVGDCACAAPDMRTRKTERRKPGARVFISPSRMGQEWNATKRARCRYRRVLRAEPSEASRQSQARKVGPLRTATLHALESLTTARALAETSRTYGVKQHRRLI